MTSIYIRHSHVNEHIPKKLKLLLGKYGMIIPGYAAKGENWLFSPNTRWTTIKVDITLLTLKLPSLLKAWHRVRNYDKIVRMEWNLPSWLKATGTAITHTHLS